MRNRAFLMFVLAVFLSCSPLTNALAQQQPVIAPEIEQLISEEGVDAAKARFTVLSASESLDMSVEIQGLYQLMSTYMSTGNSAAGEAVAEMAAQLTQNMIKQSMPGLAEQMEAQQKQEEASKAQQEEAEFQQRKAEQKRLTQSRGKSRNDLEQFKGLYAAVDDTELNRALFVTVSCDGYLVIGAMWADVSNWWMRSASDRVFSFSDSSFSFSAEFVPGQNGETNTLNHDIDGVTSPMEWKRALPEGYQDCLKRPGG